MSEYLNEKQAAKLLGVSRGTLRNWRWRKYGPVFLKVGSRVEYRRDDIDAWRDSQRRDPNEAA